MDELGIIPVLLLPGRPDQIPVTHKGEMKYSVAHPTRKRVNGMQLGFKGTALLSDNETERSKMKRTES